MPRTSVNPFQALRYSLLIKQMGCFKTGRTSGQIENSRKPILWFYTGFRKGGKLFPIPLATVLKSDCVTLKNKQDNVMSTELLFARQLIPPQTNGKIASRTAQPSSDLKKIHHLFHWTRACCSFLQTSPSSLLLSTSTSRQCRAAGPATAPLTGQSACWWLHTRSLQASTEALRLGAVAGGVMATALAESSNRKTRLSSGGRPGLCRATCYSKAKPRAASGPNHRNQKMGLMS